MLKHLAKQKTFAFRFTDAQTANSLKNAIKALPHIRGGTRTDRALELAGQDFFGWMETGDRPDVPNVLLVLTDGDTNEGSKPFPQVLPPLKVFTHCIHTMEEPSTSFNHIAVKRQIAQ